MNYLIIGATGYVGNWLYDSLCFDGSSTVIGTCRSGSCSAGQMLELDMSTEQLVLPENPFPAKYGKTAVICAAVSSIVRCHDDFEKSYRINVTNTKKLIDLLEKQGYYIVFLSSDAIFDGRKGNYTENDFTNPINAYGKMKKEVEDYIRCNFPAVCILRLSKVVGNQKFQKDLFNEWKNASLQNKTIRCIKDNYMTPVYVGDIASDIRLLSGKRSGGVYHCGGPKKYSRVDLCRSFLSSIGLKADIEECSILDLGISDGWPLDTSFVSDKIRRLGGNATPVESLFQSYKCL